jgi:hypothetical protein
MKPTIFPWLLTRYTGFPVEKLPLPIADTNSVLEQYMAKQRHLDSAKDTICNSLFQLISKTEDNSLQKLMLNLKRAIYNQRSGIEKEIGAIPENIPGIYKDELNAYVQAKHDLEAFYNSWNNTYKNTLLTHRISLQQLSIDETFRKGILLSSGILYDQLQHFSHADPSRFKSKELKNEYSVLQYLTRMVYKTSPFSTFTSIGLAILSKNPAEKNVIGPVLSKIRLNNKLLKQIKSLMIHHPELNELMYIRLNGTAVVEGDHITYLMNHENIESFQKIQLTAANSLLFNLLKNTTTTITFAELIAHLSEHIAGERLLIKQYLEGIINRGLIELHINCSEINPNWDQQLLSFLSHNSSSSAKKLCELLQVLQKSRLSYGSATVDKRKTILQVTNELFNIVMRELEREAGIAEMTKDEITALMDHYKKEQTFKKPPYIPVSFKGENTIYEDTFTNNIQQLPEQAIQVFTNKLDSLSSVLQPFDLFGETRWQMMTFFRNAYGDTASIPLIRFYKDYEQARRNGQLQAQTPPAFLLDLINKLKEKRFPSADDIHFNEQDLKITEQPLIPSSRSAFIQFWQEEERLYGVVNNLMFGMGKLSGRFLYLFDEQVSTMQKEWNKAFTGELMAMELNDGSSFNANIHPPLLEHEIRMPGSGNLMPEDCQIPVSKLSVSYAPDDNILQLYHTESGKQVYAFDLCLETLTNRSPLYRLLSSFNPIPYVSIQTFLRLVDKHVLPMQENADGIRIKARITYENDVVIRRKGWVVPSAIIPMMEEGEEHGMYYLRLHRWLRKQGIHEEVFVFLNSKKVTLPENEVIRTSKDDYKPQYINFRQPLLILLFRKLLQRSNSLIYFEEVLPAIPKETDKHITEHLLQWYHF